MAKKNNRQKTWPQAVADVAAKYGPRTVLDGLPDGTGPTQDELKRVCKCAHTERWGSRTVLLCNGKGFSLCHDHIEVRRRGAKYFLKTERDIMVRSFGNRLIVHNDMLGLKELRLLFGVFGVKDWRQAPAAGQDRTLCTGQDGPSYALKDILAGNAGLMKDALTGRIWSDETLYRRWASSSYGEKRIPWKMFRDYMASSNTYGWIAVGDLQAFTPSVQCSMREWLARSEDRNLMRDCVFDCILGGGAADLRHSTKRLNEDHLRRVRERMQAEIATKTVTPIFTHAPEERDGISLLNTELAVFNEGFTMSHCIYTHYYRSITSHDYLAFRMDTPQRCTFGVTRGPGGTLRLDQISLAYNGSVSEESRHKAETYIEENRDALLPLLAVQAPRPFDAVPFPGDDDLPF